MKAAPAGKAPTFLVAALKDPRTGNLDRIKIIKGWLDKSGKPQERIHDVVWGDADRRRIVNGKLTPVGSTVDLATASWTNTIGDPELIVQQQGGAGPDPARLHRGHPRAAAAARLAGANRER